MLLSGIRTFLERNLWRLESLYPGDFMDNAYKFAYKWNFEKVANQQTHGNAGGSAGARTPDHLIKSPLSSSNISDLTPKSMQTNADKMVRRDMLFFSFKLDKHI